MKIELHITCHALHNDEIEIFEDFCYTINAKPIVILLRQGVCVQQPMISKLLDCSTREELRQEVNFIIKAFRKNDYEIIRVKMEVPPWECENAIRMFRKEEDNYFEWHGKIHLEDEIQIVPLLAKCSGHLSRNILKKNPRAKFITIRDYTTKESIMDKISSLKKGLLKRKISLIKEELEYCVFDSNISLDNGWIE